VNIAGESQSPKRIKEVGVEQFQLLQVVDIVLPEAVGFQLLEKGCQTGGHEIIALLVGISYENGKSGLIVEVVPPIARRHGHFVKIGQQGTGKIG